MKSLGESKSLVWDGFYTKFLLNALDIIWLDIVQLFQDLIKEPFDSKHQCFLSLILKVEEAIKVVNFQPITLEYFLFEGISEEPITEHQPTFIKIWSSVDCICIKDNECNFAKKESFYNVNRRVALRIHWISLTLDMVGAFFWGNRINLALFCLTSSCLGNCLWCWVALK